MTPSDIHTYNQPPVKMLKLPANGLVVSFIDKSASQNIDWTTVDSFGEEWTKFSSFSKEEIDQIGNDYFDIVTEDMLNQSSKVLDVGCGTGRWTKYVASKAGFVEAIDPSIAVVSASHLLKENNNVRITQAEVSNIPFEDNSFDFVFSLGVLHHIPDTKKAMQNCIDKLKPNGYFLVYLYYALDNRGFLFRILFRLSNIIRNGISKLPAFLKKYTCDLIAILIYLPFVLLAKITKSLFPNSGLYNKIPLSWYHDKSINVIRNDSLDRFGTPLEQRFTKLEIREMMESCGLTNIQFSNKEPYWHAVGRKR